MQADMTTFRSAVLLTWAAIILVGFWILRGGFGVRIPRGWGDKVLPKIFYWFLTPYGLIFLCLAGLVASYLLIKVIDGLDPSLLRR